MSEIEFTDMVDAEEFDFVCLFGHLDNNLRPIRGALSTLAVLLTENELEAFHGDTPYASDNRWGLKKLVELCLLQEERVLDRFEDLWKETAYYLYLKAKDTLKSERYIETLPHGWKRAPVAAKEIKKAIDNLEIVIQKDEDLAGKAEELKVKCINALKQFKG